MPSDATRAEFFYFNTSLRLFDTTRAGVTVAFCGERSFDHGRFGEGLKAAVAYPNDPGLVILLGLEPYQDAFEDLLAEMEMWTPPGVKVIILVIDSLRHIKIVGENPDGVLELDRMSEYAKTIFESGLRAMFHAVPTVMRSSPGYHFEAPGGKHMTTFVRAGNMFVDSARARFAACSVLDKIGNLGSIQLISTDTSSINALAYELRHLQETFFPDEAAAVVGSFGGHPALDQRVSLGPARTTLFLVSVSSTGSLTKRVLEDRGGARVVVLVALGVIAAGANAMFAPDHLDSVDVLELDEIIPVDRRQCVRCTEYNETVVKIDGEQLLPLAPSVFSRLLTLAQARAWQPKHLQAMVLLDSIVAHYVPKTRGTTASRRPLYFSFESFFDSLSAPVSEQIPPSVAALRSETLQKLQKMLDELKPTHIVHLPDASSRALGLAAQKLAHDRETVLLDSRTSYSGEIGEDDNRILVVASAAASGSALNSLSRELRPVVTKAIVRYFVFMPRTQDADTWAFLRSNLRVGVNTGSKTTVEEVATAWLPSEKTLLGSVWDDELEFWDRFIELAPRRVANESKVALEAFRQIDARRSVLTKGSLKDNLFLNSGSDMNDFEGRLRLQDNFALWNFSYDRDMVNQAAVYMTFSAVLDWSRSPGGGKDHQDYHTDDVELGLERFFDTTQRQHNLTAVHPFNFDRYNDAVTNAALLRGSLPWELDYSASPGLSASMLAVLDGVIDSFAGQGDSALVEYLLAIASRRLRLHPKHLDLFISKLTLDLPPVAVALRDYIVKTEIGTPFKLAEKVLT